MKIAFFELEDWEFEIIKEKFSDHELFLYKEKLQDKLDEVKDIDIISVFIYSPVTKKEIKQMPNLKLITTRSTGFDHIDLDVAKANDIIVCNVPNYGENTVAEHTFALILALSRKVIQAVERTRAGNFDLKGLRGFDLKGKTIGVVGTGSIGEHVIRIANGFEMNIVAFDVNKRQDLIDKYNIQYVEFDALLGQSDIITFHVPLNPHTKHMINTDNLDKIKKETVLINTSRGQVVQTDAIMKGLKNNTFKAVGLDVLEEEPEMKEEAELLSSEFEKESDLKTLLEQHILREKENVIITPHNAFNSHEALRRILDTTIKNIKKYLEGSSVNTVE